MWLKIPVNLDTEAANAHLLKELDRWIALELLSEAQAISIGRQLCSRLPLTYKAPAPADRKSTRLNSSHPSRSRMPSSA